MQPPAHVQMLDLALGHFHSRAIYVAVTLGIPDLLTGGPRTAVELAREAGAHPRALYRLLRALASLGIFVEDGEERFSLTALGDTLRGDTPNSVRAAILLGGAPMHWNSWTSLDHSVRTGQSAFEHVHGMQFFEYLADHPEDCRLFADWMTRVSQLNNPAIVGAYDFSAARTVADIGGGHGSLLVAILTANPHLRGILYDRPEVVRGAREIGLAGVGDRCLVARGDFFESAPVGADLYLLKTILHDWNDEFAGRILPELPAGDAGRRPDPCH
jgi:hypothetical protein